MPLASKSASASKRSSVGSKPLLGCARLVIAVWRGSAGCLPSHWRLTIWCGCTISRALPLKPTEESAPASEQPTRPRLINRTLCHQTKRPGACKNSLGTVRIEYEPDNFTAKFSFFSNLLDTYFVRRLVMERLPDAEATIPGGYGPPEMTPVSTSLGEIFQFEVIDPRRSPMELRSILDWRIAPRLKEVPGVVEVNSFGGELKTYEVQIRPEALVAYKLTLSEVFKALEKNNLSAGGGYIIHNGEQQVIRGAGLVTNLTDIGNIVVGSRNGVPIYIRNLGGVAFAPMLRQGAVTRDGKGETVAGIVMLLIGENSRTVVDRVKAKIAEIKQTLPKEVQIVPYYDRAELIRRTIDTVAHNLAEGAILVSVLVFLFLGDIRASLIVASVIPLSMLAAFIGMNWMD